MRLVNEADWNGDLEMVEKGHRCEEHLTDMYNNCINAGTWSKEELRTDIATFRREIELAEERASGESPASS